MIWLKNMIKWVRQWWLTITAIEQHIVLKKHFEDIGPTKSPQFKERMILINSVKSLSIKGNTDRIFTNIIVFNSDTCRYSNRKRFVNHRKGVFYIIVIKALYHPSQQIIRRIVNYFFEIKRLIGSNFRKAMFSNTNIKPSIVCKEWSWTMATKGSIWEIILFANTTYSHFHCRYRLFDICIIKISCQRVWWINCDTNLA